MVFVGLFGMFVLSRHEDPGEIPLKGNYFWLHNKYYLRVAEGGLYGVILLIVIIVAFRNGQIDRPTIAALCVTCTIKVLYCGLAVWSYFKLRQVKKAHETTQSQAEKPQTEDLYRKMLLGFVKVPGWHILLSTFLMWLVTTGFITTPTALISLAEDSSNTSLFEKFAQNEPQYVQFHSTAFPPPPSICMVTRI
jgi:Ca2+/Na+ antiporter